MIRRAEPHDLDGLVKLAQHEHALSLMAGTPFDVAVSRSRFAHCLRAIDSCVFVSEQDGQVAGMIAGMAQGNLHNRFTTVYELIWYALDGSGLKLLECLRDWANKMRATALVVHNYAGIKSPDRFNRAMTRKGFTQLGVSFMAALEN